MTATARTRGHGDPIVIGVLLGGLLFATIFLAGRGLGASGGFAAGAAASVAAVAPDAAAGNAYIAERVPTGRGGVLGEWLVLELLAVAFGAWWSARRGGRAGVRVEPDGLGDRRPRMVRALAGGALMGGGARLAHGCTSGLALTGGALLSTGAWLFIPLAFGAAFAVAWLLRRVAGSAA